MLVVLIELRTGLVRAVPPGALMQTVRRHPLTTFFVLSYVIAWVFLPFGSFGAFAPLVAALVVIPISSGRAGLQEWGARLVRWRVGGRWWAVAIGVPLVVHLLTATALLVSGRPPLGSGNTLGVVVLAALVRLVNPLDGPWGEEPGWRGFALPGLQGRHSPLVSTAVLAVAVTGWHAPLVFLEPGGFDASLALSFVVATVAVTFWYSWLFNRTGGSVLLVVVAHVLEGAIQAEGWVYAAVWIVIALLLVLGDPRAWRRPTPAGATTVPPPGVTTG
jgi:hypothetical protein